MPRALPFLDTAVPFGIAHRGGNDGAPENSMAAFQRAVDLGYRYLETDVHRTSDGVLVAFHDEDLDRVTDRTGRISELSWAEVSQARIGGKEPIPRLEEVLRTWPHIRVNIEPKSDDAVPPLVRVVRQTGSLDRICIGSFDDGRVDECRDALGPDLCTSPGAGGFLRVGAHMAGLRIGNLEVNCLQIPTHWFGLRIVTKRFVSRAHDLGLQVHVWTVNEEDEMRRLFADGVDAIMSDELSLLNRVLASLDS